MQWIFEVTFDQVFWNYPRCGCDLTLVMITASYMYVQLAFSGLKQVIHDQTRQNGYQTVPFSVYIHNLLFVFIFDQVFWN